MVLHRRTPLDFITLKFTPLHFTTRLQYIAFRFKPKQAKAPLDFRAANSTSNLVFNTSQDTASQNSPPLDYISCPVISAHHNSRLQCRTLHDNSRLHVSASQLTPHHPSTTIHCAPLHFFSRLQVCT